MVEGIARSSASATTVPSDGTPAPPPLSQVLSVLAQTLERYGYDLIPRAVEAREGNATTTPASPSVKQEEASSSGVRMPAVDPKPAVAPEPEPVAAPEEADNIVSSFSSLTIGQAGPSAATDPPPPPPASSNVLCARCKSVVDSGGYDPNATEVFVLPSNPPSNDRWHAITRGTRLGVFQGWGVASAYVSGISNAAHKGYKTKEEAIGAYRSALAAGNVSLVVI